MKGSKGIQIVLEFITDSVRFRPFCLKSFGRSLAYVRGGPPGQTPGLAPQHKQVS